MSQYLFFCNFQALKDLFSGTYANVHRPRKGQGFVEFADKRGLEYALDNKQDLELDGKRLKIREAGKSETDRSASLDGFSNLLQ